MASSKIYGPTPAASVPATLVVITATEEPVLNPTDSTGLTPLMVIIPAGSLLEKQAFEILASGTLTMTSGTGGATIKLYAVPSAVINSKTAATLANSTAVGTTGAIVTTAVAAPFVLRARNCIYDTTSGKLCGQMEALVNDTIVASAAFSTVLTGVNGQTDPVVGFLLSLTASAGTGTLLVQDFGINQ